MTQTVARSNLNLALYSHDLKPLINPRVVWEVTEDLVCTSTGWAQSLYDLWSLQINCNTPSNTQSTPGYLQFGVGPISQFADPTTATVYNFVAAIQSNDYFLGENSQQLLNSIPLPVPAGYKFDMTVVTDPMTLAATGVRTLVYNPQGVQVADVFRAVSSITGYTPAWAVPITTLSLELVGPGGASSTFSSGAGRFTYYPSGGQTYDWVAVAYAGGNPYYPFPPGLPVARNAQHTAETSNQQYSNAMSQTDGSYLQYHSWNGTYPQSGPPQPTTLTLSVTPLKS